MFVIRLITTFNQDDMVKAIETMTLSDRNQKQSDE